MSKCKVRPKEKLQKSGKTLPGCPGQMSDVAFVAIAVLT